MGFVRAPILGYHETNRNDINFRAYQRMTLERQLEVGPLVPVNQANHTKYSNTVKITCQLTKCHIWFWCIARFQTLTGLCVTVESFPYFKELKHEPVPQCQALPLAICLPAAGALPQQTDSLGSWFFTRLSCSSQS